MQLYRPHQCSTCWHPPALDKSGVFPAAAPPISSRVPGVLWLPFRSFCPHIYIHLAFLALSASTIAGSLRTFGTQCNCDMWHDAWVRRERIAQRAVKKDGAASPSSLGAGRSRGYRHVVCADATSSHPTPPTATRQPTETRLAAKEADHPPAHPLSHPVRQATGGGPRLEGKEVDHRDVVAELQPRVLAREVRLPIGKDEENAERVGEAPAEQVGGVLTGLESRATAPRRWGHVASCVAGLRKLALFTSKTA